MKPIPEQRDETARINAALAKRRKCQSNLQVAVGQYLLCYDMKSNRWEKRKTRGELEAAYLACLEANEEYWDAQDREGVYNGD